MGKAITWTIEDEVVALHLALHGVRGLDYDADQMEDIIANTLFPKKGFRMRVQNYRYIVTKGKEGLDAGYPQGFPLYRNLTRIFSSMDASDFTEYVNLILSRRDRMATTET